MTDKRITELTELATVSVDDLLAIVDDPAGTPVTKKVTVANLLAGVSGGGAEVIGPFHVEWDDADLVDPVLTLGVSLAAIPTGSVVVTAWAAGTAFNNNATLWLYLADGNLATSNGLALYVADAVSVSTAGPYTYRFPLTADAQSPSAVPVDSQLVVAIYSGSGPVVQGTADIYALVQYP